MRYPKCIVANELQPHAQQTYTIYVDKSCFAYPFWFTFLFRLLQITIGWKQRLYHCTLLLLPLLYQLWCDQWQSGLLFINIGQKTPLATFRKHSNKSSCVRWLLGGISWYSNPFLATETDGCCRTRGYLSDYCTTDSTSLREPCWVFHLCEQKPQWSFVLLGSPVQITAGRRRF